MKKQHPLIEWMIPRSRVEWTALLSPLALGGLALMSGCTTLGTNVSGSFACAAPNGTCAPSRVIDDQALAQITSEAAAAKTIQSGPYEVDDGDGPPSHIARRSDGSDQVAMAPGDGRVLRIVFPAYVDRLGRLHEKTAIQAVANVGDWNRAMAQRAARTPDGRPGLMDAAESAPDLLAMTAPVPLPALVEAASPVSTAAAAPAPKDSGPIAGIKAQVAERLSENRARRSAASFPGKVD